MVYVVRECMFRCAYTVSDKTYDTEIKLQNFLGFRFKNPYRVFSKKNLFFSFIMKYFILWLTDHYNTTGGFEQKEILNKYAVCWLTKT